MKLIAIALTVAALAAPAGADPGKHSMKGWELYTWFDLSCSASPQVHSAPNPDSWCAALVPGTNRVKRAAEIKKARMAWRDLAPALGTLRSGEDIAWITAPGEFDAPPPALRDPVTALAAQRKLALTNVARK